ncbi:MAG TPA: hypothetical protein VM008_09825 [Phycisphaerae bacterium]|nr:hypothetical protein [Phycisphaerae bacterium]
MDDATYIILSQIGNELNSRRGEASRSGQRFDRGDFLTFVERKHGAAYGKVALILLAVDTGPTTTQNFYGDTKMSNNTVQGNVIGGAVGDGNKVKTGDITVGSHNKSEVQYSLPDAYAKFLDHVNGQADLVDSEKEEAKDHADSLKTELEKPEKDRNGGFIARTFKKLCAVAPEAAGRFFGSFTAAYMEHRHPGA